MRATIYHNPMCGTSRGTLAMLEKAGANVRVIEYLKAPPSKEELRRLYERAGLTPREGLRAKEPLAVELGLLDADDETILEVMAANPILIERPIVIRGGRAVVARPPERVLELLD